MEREYDCPLAQAQVNWIPIDDPELPQVEVVGNGLDDDPRYENSWGACHWDFEKAGSSEKLEMLFAQFVYMTVVDGVSPANVHKAFSVIPEYRRALVKIGFQV